MGCFLCIYAWKTHHIRLHVECSLPEDEKKMFETYRRQDKRNSDINFKKIILLVNIKQMYQNARYKNTKYLINLSKFLVFF